MSLKLSHFLLLFPKLSTYFLKIAYKLHLVLQVGGSHSGLVSGRKLFFIVSLTPVFSTSAVAGITQDYSGDCTASTGTVSHVFHFLPHLFCILAVVAGAIPEQPLCMSARSHDEKCRSCIMSKLSSTFLRNINHLLSCFMDVKPVICSK